MSFPFGCASSSIPSLRQPCGFPRDSPGGVRALVLSPQGAEGLWEATSGCQGWADAESPALQQGTVPLQTPLCSKSRDGRHLHAVPRGQRGGRAPLAGQHRERPQPGVSRGGPVPGLPGPRALEQLRTRFRSVSRGGGGIRLLPAGRKLPHRRGMRAAHPPAASSATAAPSRRPGVLGRPPLPQGGCCVWVTASPVPSHNLVPALPVVPWGSSCGAVCPRALPARWVKARCSRLSHGSTSAELPLGRGAFLCPSAASHSHSRWIPGTHPRLGCTGGAGVACWGIWAPSGCAGVPLSCGARDWGGGRWALVVSGCSAPPEPVAVGMQRPRLPGPSLLLRPGWSLLPYLARHGCEQMGGGGGGWGEPALASLSMI